jgi:hypothetical protein
MISREFLRFFPDLSIYETDDKLPLPDVLNVGWLSIRNEFNIGDPPKEFVAKLKKLIEVSFCQNGKLKLVMGLWRGEFHCPLCNMSSFDIQEKWDMAGLGNAEIWIPSYSRKQCHYSSSTWIYHYIIDHNYLPPGEYIESILFLDETLKINANIIAFDLEIKYRSLKTGVPIDQNFVNHMHKILEK